MNFFTTREHGSLENLRDHRERKRDDRRDRWGAMDIFQ